MGFVRSIGFVSSEVYGKLEEVALLLSRCEALREGGGGGGFVAYDSEEGLDGNGEVLPRDWAEALLRDNGGLLGPWLRRRVSGGVGGRLICVDESVSRTEVILLRLEESEVEIDAGGGGSGLFKSESGDLGPGRVEVLSDARGGCREGSRDSSCICLIGLP